MMTGSTAICCERRPVIAFEAASCRWITELFAALLDDIDATALTPLERDQFEQARHAVLREQAEAEQRFQTNVFYIPV